MSEKTVIDANVLVSEFEAALNPVPFYKNKKFIAVTAAVTAAVAGVVIYKFTQNGSDEDSYETADEADILDALNSDPSLTEK